MKIIKTNKDAEIFLKSILNPKLPGKKLLQARKRYLKKRSEVEIIDINKL